MEQASFKFLEVSVLHDSDVSDKDLEESTRELVGGILTDKGNVSINGKKDSKLYDFECINIERGSEYGEVLTHYTLGFNLR